MSENKHTKGDLAQMQSLPLSIKISMTKRRIRDWYDYWDGNVYISFSGGKDSTVLLHIARQMYPDIEAVFVNTGLEYPELREFVRTISNVIWIKPKMNFRKVIETYGYPLISKEVSQKIYTARRCPTGAYAGRFESNNEHTQKYGNRYSIVKWKELKDSNIPISHMCCEIMKKRPSKQYEKKSGNKPIVGTMTCEGQNRRTSWLRHGCNSFDGNRPISQPMSFWTEQDVLQYIKRFDVPIASVYGDIVYAKDAEQTRLEDFGVDGVGSDKLVTTGCDRTGCIFCAFGCHLEREPSRFQRLKVTHPKQYEYCIGGGEYDENGIWKPNKQGLGMGHVFDELNKIYGDGFIKY